MSSQIFAQDLFVSSFDPGYNTEKQKTTAAFETNDGFLLIGTKGGLFSFDGVTYYKLDFPDSLSQKEVTIINENSNFIYVGLSNGIVLKYDQKETKLAPQILFKSEAEITDIEFFNTNEIWVSTYGDGIYILKNQSKPLHLTQATQLPDNFIYDLQKDSSQNIWAGTDAGLVRMYYVDKQLKSAIFNQTDGLPDLIVTALCLDKNHQLWIGFQEAGFCQIEINKELLVCIPSISEWNHGAIKSLICMDDYLWIGTIENSLLAFQFESGALYSWPKQSSLPQRIIQLKKSHLDGFWIISNDRLVWTTGRQIERSIQFDQLSSNEPLAILVDRNNNLWYSTENGLYKKSILNEQNNNLSKIELQTNGNDPFISCLFEDKNGNIWMGTFDQGLLIMNPQTGKITRYNESNGLVNNNILSISASTNEIWLATLGGASKAIIEKEGKIQFENFNAENGAGTNYIYQVYTDSKNRTWFATDGNGIRLYENGQFSTPQQSIIENKVIYSVTEAKDGSMWFASSDEGLFCLKNDRLRHFGLEEGLHSLSITSIIGTNSNYLLVASNQGFDLIDVTNGEIIQLSNRYGIHSEKASLNAFALDKDGIVYLGNNKGIYRLENIESLAERKPMMRLRRMMVNLQAYHFNQKMVLAHNESQISLDYSGIWYPNPEDIRFKIKLSGSENSTYETRDHVLNFGNLRPGKYNLQISEAADFMHDNTVIELDLQIKKPLWQEWWFIVLLIITVSLSIYFWIKQRELKLRKQQLILQERLEFEYANLRNQVNPHFLFNSFSTLIAMIESDGIDAIGYVEKLSDYFRQILQFRDTALITLDEELKLLENYVFLQQKRYGKGLTLTIYMDNTLYDSNIPPMTLQMLCENALKHNIASKSKPLEIKIECTPESIKISNNIQAKTTAEVSTGLGLKNISERYRVFANKKIEIIQTETSFTVLLPIIK